MKSKKEIQDLIISRFLTELRSIIKKEDRIKFFEDLLTLSNQIENKVLVSFCEGYILYYKKKYDNAKDTFLAAIGLDPKFCYLWYGLGNTYDELKDFEKAKEAYSRAIELDPKFIYAWNGLGNVYRELKDYAKGEEAYNKAIELDPKFIYPWNGLGNIYRDLEDYGKAKDAYNKAIKLNPKYYNTWNNLGIFYKKIKDFEKANEAYLKSIELEEVNPHANRNLGLLLFYNLNEKEEARKYFQKAKELFEKENESYFVSITQNNINSVLEAIKFEKQLEKEKTEDKSKDPLFEILSKTENFEKEIYEKQKKFLSFVEDQKPTIDDIFYIKVLRRWNSYTPIVADNYHLSKGGGYFLKAHGKGIVIDPGFNFIENFKGAGHCFDEIDFVFISHAHNDHTSDLESILTLLNSCNKRRKGIDDLSNEDTVRSDLAKAKGAKIDSITEDEIEKEFNNKSPRRKIIHFYFTKSVEKKFCGMLNLFKSENYDCHIVEAGDEKEILNNLIKIDIIDASHNDIISDRDSVGFIFQFQNNVLVYTGDTGWNDKIEIQYKEVCKKFKGKSIVLLCHLGGFKEKEKKYLDPKQRQGAFYRQHLGRLGLGKLIMTLKPELCFVSEFGEELKNFREKICEVYHQVFPKTIFIPADIGLEYHFINNEIKAISKIDLEKNTYDVSLTTPKFVKTCLLRKDYSLHYYKKSKLFSESDLIQLLGEEFNMSTK
jgi:tetratricopeptide (TPR) repeat protein/metal-dependent hydrolase (beta-lactamase superfamily II)